ncbi:transglycosylase SLT domain-containing protein [Nonomuraea typhae]|uniref:transglycosylase SLT domain-containing protein n=1 Tax=Nonomuraea typhae TaxID=2603600 RepID=UPI0015E1FFAA|nr:transglycosylase SLT domain-containing protein [Nonomuraea typhae]
MSETEDSMPGITALAEKRNKVTGNPAAIRLLATHWRTAAGNLVDHTGALSRAVNQVTGAWHGVSADAFSKYMAVYSRAGDELHDALAGGANALDTAATALETAQGKLNTLYTNTVTRANEYRTRYKKENPGATEAQIKPGVTDIVSQANKDADPLVTEAADAVDKAEAAVRKALGDREITFAATNKPGDQNFTPKPGTKLEWQRRPKSEVRNTNLSGYGNGNGTGSGSGSPGGGAAPGAGGGAPAPKAEVVAWIKEALTIIKANAAKIKAERGIDVSDLDPDDPVAIERIWTIIYHESGGNPKAINNWDINAQNGVPSQGLMQTIPPTFNAHKLAGYDDILAPVDNIIAGVLYTYDRYGNLANHPGINSLERGGDYKPY